MMKLDNFVDMMTGHFNNKEQFDKLKKEGKAYPYAEHINTICNEKILNLPKDFNGKFVVEESYYETNGKRHASPHLFLVTEKEDGILLYSYEIPEGEDKSTFSYDSMKNVDYTELKKSEKFTPALYHEKDGIWEGGSTSRFSPVMTFKLLDMMNQLSISEYNPRMEYCDKFRFVELRKSEFVERFPELSLFYRLFSPLDSEMICIFPYFCPCEIIVREIREILF